MAQAVRRDMADAVRKTARAAVAELAAEVARRKEAERKLSEVSSSYMQQHQAYMRSPFETTTSAVCCSRWHAAAMSIAEGML